MKKKSKWTITLILLALVVSGCGSKEQEIPTTEIPQEPLLVIAEGHIIPRDSMYLSFAARGRVAEILVEEGEQVNEGQVLIRLGDTQQAEAALAGAKLEQALAQQAYDEFLRSKALAGAQNWQKYLHAQSATAILERQWEALDLDAIQKRIDDTEVEVQDRQADLDEAQKTFDKYKDLDPDNPTRKQAEDDLQQAQEDYNEAVRIMEAIIRDMDGIRAGLELAQAAEDEARRKYEATLEGPDAETLVILQTRLDNAQAQVAAAESALANYELKAPFAGTVTDINVLVNELVGPEKWAILIADFSQWYVDTSDLTELEVVKIAEGQMVSIVPDALPDVILNGFVERISQSFKYQGGDIQYTVHIQLKDPEPRLRWGMTVEVTFEP